MLQNIVLVAVGSAAGGVLRYLAGVFFLRPFPSVFLVTSTVVVNVLGSFLIGLLLGYGAVNWVDSDHPLRLMLAIGFCGGFTTFSTFSAESLALLQAGDFLMAGVYILGTVALCLAAVWAGYSIINM